MFIERLVKNNLNLQNLKWLTYLSSTSVYGNHDGAWVNEDSTTNPQTLAGKNRLNVEKDWLSIGTKNSLPVQIFRLSGLGFILIDTMQLPDLEMIKNLLLKKKITFFQGYTLKI